MLSSTLMLFYLKTETKQINNQPTQGKGRKKREAFRRKREKREFFILNRVINHSFVIEENSYSSDVYYSLFFFFGGRLRKGNQIYLNYNIKTNERLNKYPENSNHDNNKSYLYFTYFSHLPPPPYLVLHCILYGYIL